MRYLVYALIWFALAVAAGATGVTERLHPPLPQVVLLGLTAGLLLAAWLVRPFARFIASLDWSALVAIHITRFVGLYFLWAQGRGHLPRAFAVPGGIGDVAVATGALLLLVLGKWVMGRPSVLFLWNALGLADILFVVFTAARLAQADPASMAALQRLPLSLLSTFLVPIVIASHVLVFMRLPRWKETV